MDKLTKNKKRIILIGIIFAALIYPGYQIIKYYTSDKSAYTSLTLLKTDTNIATTAQAYYEMGFGEGNLEMSNTVEKDLPDGSLSSIVKLDTVNGETVSKTELKIHYDDSLAPENEFDIALARIENGKYVLENFKIDTKENYVSATVSGSGEWCLADANKISK